MCIDVWTHVREIHYQSGIWGLWKQIKSRTTFMPFYSIQNFMKNYHIVWFRIYFHSELWCSWEFQCLMLVSFTSVLQFPWMFFNAWGFLAAYICMYKDKPNLHGITFKIRTNVSPFTLCIKHFSPNISEKERF